MVKCLVKSAIVRYFTTNHFNAVLISPQCRVNLEEQQAFGGNPVREGELRYTQFGFIRIYYCGSQLNYCWPSGIGTISRPIPTAHFTNSSSSFCEDTSDKLVNECHKLKEYYDLSARKLERPEILQKLSIKVIKLTKSFQSINLKNTNFHQDCYGED